MLKSLFIRLLTQILRLTSARGCEYTSPKSWKNPASMKTAVRITTEAACLFEKIDNHALKGKFHVGLPRTLRALVTVEQREDYIDRALIEYAAASYHFERAGHERYRANVENNLGFL